MKTTIGHKHTMTGNACGGFGGVDMRVVGIHTGDTKRGWFINTSFTRGDGGSVI